MSSNYAGLWFLKEESSIGDSPAEAPAKAPAVAPVEAPVEALVEPEDPFRRYTQLSNRADRFGRKIAEIRDEKSMYRRKLRATYARILFALRNIERELQGKRTITAPRPLYDPRNQDRDGLGLAYAKSRAERRAIRKRKSAQAAKDR
jgi:hypothetical protein